VLTLLLEEKGRDEVKVLSRDKVRILFGNEELY